MLILSRKEREEIHVGEAVIRIHRIKGKTVAVGIDAPRNIRIVRGELPRKEPPADELPRR